MNIKEEIIELTKVIPDSVKRGSVQVSIRWKDCAADAMRAVNNPKSTDHELRMALQNLKRYG
jgi:hypothetical protein